MYDTINNLKFFYTKTSHQSLHKTIRDVNYGYFLAQTAVSLAYGLGPLLGGNLSETLGFTTVLRTVGCINFCYIPFLYFLKKRTCTPRSGYEKHSNMDQQVNMYYSNLLHILFIW